MPVLIILAVLILAALLIDMIDLHRFVPRTYEFTGFKVARSTTFVQLSDLHNHVYGRDNETLLQAIDRVNPDFIVVTGDMVNGKKKEKFDSTLLFLKKLAQNYAVYYEYGNHECRLEKKYPEDYLRFAKALEQTGVTLLRNHNTFLPEYGIRLYGLELPKKFYLRGKPAPMNPEDLTGLMGTVDDSVCNVLLAHLPDYAKEYAGWGADLTLSGHIHGGLVRLPGLGGVVSPRVRFFPKYDGGEFTEMGRKMVVSRGLGFHSLPIRIFNPGELVIITLKP